ncbi:glycosyltransferase family 2 protein [Histidinibacterium lentulum]|uniref:Glycosyltransferase family 2 protein n=1 Tax=Histidinibacterium lentulum TaxID=2480588 RepID=A0A3N2QV51_9RHOB|nr:glycosyltransferase family 2 protein [Histidinibacterium lentulum]ROT99103.1 glycosyltransferase family 2 protein [Histidinibacterium lentulum]
MKASVLILTYNEEINIRRCLESLEGFDDVVVIDSGSMDATCAIANGMGARILTRPFDNFANQRNFGLDEGGFVHEWVLHLDADEVLTPAFRTALAALPPTDALDGWRVPSKTMLNGKWLQHAGMYPTYQARLGHRDRLRFRQVGHGQREDVPPDRLGTFPEPYLHYSFSHGLAKWFAKHVRYAEDEARQLAQDATHPAARGRLLSGNATERRRALKAMVGRLPVWLRPPLRFFHVLVLRRGILDGRAGVQYALMLSAYEAMIGAFSFRRPGDQETL